MDDILKDLTKEQKALLVSLLKEEKRKPLTRGYTVKEEDMIYVVDCILTCQLCKVETVVQRKSSEQKIIKGILSTCPACRDRLIALGAETLADMLIKIFKIEAPKTYYIPYPRRAEDEPTVEEVENAVDEVLKEANEAE